MMARSPEEMSYRVRAWWDLASGGTPIGVMLVADDDTCLCLAMALDRETMTWSAGAARFDADAFDAEGHVLIDAMEMVDGTEFIKPVGYPRHNAQRLHGEECAAIRDA